MVNFTIGENITLAFQLECFEDELAAWKRQRPSADLKVVLQLDGKPLVTYSVPPKPSCCPPRVWSLQLMVGIPKFLWICRSQPVWHKLMTLSRR